MKRMGILRCVLATAALLAAPSLASAAMVFSDTFTKPDGSLNGTTPDLSGGNWTATAAAATPLQIASNAVQFGASGQDEYAALTAPVGNTPGTYMVTRMDINVASATAAGDYFAHVSNPLGTSTLFFQRLFARSSGSGFQLGLLDTSGTGSATTWGADVLNFGQTYRVAVTWNFVAGTVNDTFSVSVGGSPYLTHNWTSVNAEPAAIAAVNLRQGGASSSAILTLDNLSVEVVPEPTSFALTSVVALAALGRLRRR